MFGKLLYDEQKPVAMFVTFMGAATEIDDEGMLGPAQRGELGDPPVDAAEPIGARGSAGDLADGHVTSVPCGQRRAPSEPAP